MYVRGRRIYAHWYFCVVPTPVCVIYANCSCPFYFSTPNDHVSSLCSIPLVYLLKLNSESFFFHVTLHNEIVREAPRGASVMYAVCCVIATRTFLSFFSPFFFLFVTHPPRVRHSHTWLFLFSRSYPG
jgi:hypothetical protein